MATNTRDANLVQQGEISLFAFIQDDLDDAASYQGLVGIDSLTDPQGDLAPIRIWNPAVPNQWLTVGKTRSAPDLGECNLTENVDINKKTLGQKMKQALCDWGFIIKVGKCGRKDDITQWNQLIAVNRASLVERDFGTLLPVGNEGANETLTYTTNTTHEGVDTIFPATLGEKADSIALAEALDGQYRGLVSCGTCDTYDSGCDTKFVLTAANSASPGKSGQIVFTTNGQDFNTDDINSLGGASGTSLAIVGNYLVVTQNTTARHHYRKINDVISNPNGYGWTSVSTGYETGDGGLCSEVGSSNRFFVGGSDGFIYASDNITVGVNVIHDASLTTENFNKIRYAAGAVLAVGDNGVILLSTNADNDFASIVFELISPPSSLSAVNITACEIISTTQFMIGAANGTMWYTMDKGLNWTQRTLPNQDNLTRIDDIQLSPDNEMIGAIAARTASAGYIFRSFDNTRTWFMDAPTITQLSTAPSRYNFATLCGGNSILCGGLKSGSTDGIIAEANG